MSLSKAQTITLCEGLCLDLQDDATLSQFFDDSVEALSLLDKPVFYETALVSLTSGTATYNFESDMLRLLYAVMEDAEIFMTDEAGLDAYSNSWRTATGTPVAVTQERLSRQYTLYPNPDFNSGALIPVNGEPLGEDYPEDQLFIIYAQDRAASIQDYYALPLAIMMLAKEFSYAANKEDIEFAAQCDQLSKMLLALLGH